MSNDLNYQIHNCHTHIFNIDYLPSKFINRFIPIRVAKMRMLSLILKRLFLRNDNRMYAFLFAAKKDSQEAIFEELCAYYPSSAKFVVLSVDFDFMKAGKPKIDFLGQIENLHKVATKVNKDKERLLPFLGVDPRRKNVLDLVKEYIEEKHFKGLKIYPALGFFPDDERLIPVYEYAVKYNIPIVTHCIPKNKNHYRGKIKEEWIEKAREIAPDPETKAYDFAQYLLHPHWYGKLLEMMPELKINFGHFGGSLEWNKHLDIPRTKASHDNWYSLIRDLLKRYPNTYADISFTVHDSALYPLLYNVLRSDYRGHPEFYSLKEKVLFGTDFYMLQKDYNEKRFGLDVRGYLTDELYWQIAELNPKKYLETKM